MLNRSTGETKPERTSCRAVELFVLEGAALPCWSVNGDIAPCCYVFCVVVMFSKFLSRSVTIYSEPCCHGYNEVQGCLYYTI